MSSIKYQWVNQIKGLSILMVVFYHAVITFFPYTDMLEGSHNTDLISSFWMNFNLIITPFRMPVFFFISGFLVFKYVESIPIKECLDKRVLSIIWILVIWLIIQSIVVKFSNHFFSYPIYHNPNSNVVYSDSISSLISNLLKASTSLWYLYALIFNFLVFKLLKNYKVYALAICIFLHFYSYFDFLNLGWGANSILRNAIYYGIGCYFGPVLVNYINNYRISEHKLFISILAIAILIISVTKIKLFISLFSIFVVIKFFMHISNKQNWVLRQLEIIGTHTLSVYVIHRALLEFISLLMFVCLKNSHVVLIGAVFLIYPLISTGASIKISLAIESCSKKYLNNYLFQKPESFRIF